MAEAWDRVQGRLVEARRAQILDAATKVFAERGFHRATIKEIARAGGVADGTIYNYFDNKKDLLIGILDRLNESGRRGGHFEQGMDVDFRTFFVAYLRQRIHLLWPNYEVFQAVLPEILVDSELRELYYRQLVLPTLEIAERYFREMVKRGEMRDVDVPLTVRSLAGNVLGLLILQILGDEQIRSRWEELPDVLAEIVFRGLGTEGDRDE